MRIPHCSGVRLRWRKQRTEAPSLALLTQKFIDKAWEYGSQGALVAARLKNLPIVYGKLPGETGGVCYYYFSQAGDFVPHSVGIDLDKILAFHNSTTITPEVAATVESFLFHELTHCGLGIGHVPYIVPGTESFDGEEHPVASLMLRIATRNALAQAQVPAVWNEVLRQVFEKRVVAQYDFPWAPKYFSEKYMLSLVKNAQNVASLDRYAYSSNGLSLAGDSGQIFSSQCGEDH